MPVTQEVLDPSFIHEALDRFKYPFNGRVSEWIHALNSSEYRQGCNALRTNDDAYCCLGVASDIFDPYGWKVQDNVDNMWMYDYDGESSELDIVFAVQTYYGLRDGGFFKPNDLPEYLKDKVIKCVEDNTEIITMSESDPRADTSWTLIELNDIGKVPFPIIAEVILTIPEYIFEDWALVEGHESA